MLKALLVFIFGVGISEAAIINAATCSLADVTTAVGLATRNQDTVVVPAGSCTWSGTLSLTFGIAIRGAGAGSTVITDNTSPAINITPDSTAIANSENIQISGFTLDGNLTALTIIQIHGTGSSGTIPYRQILIHDNTFQKNSTNTSSNGVIYITGQVRGVIWNNIFDKCDMPIRPTGNDSTTEWANTNFNNFAYGSSDQLFFESNTIEFTSTSAAQDPGWIQAEQGGRMVGRFNTWNMTNATQQEVWDIHGFQNWDGTPNSGQTSEMIMEYYRNTITSASGYRLINHRGSWLMAFDNTLTGTSMDIEVNQYDNPATGGSGCPGQINPTPVNYNPLVNNSYVFNNKVNGTNKLMGPGSIGLGCGIAENANYWNQNNSFNGTVGIGIGTLASIPGTCTTGVGYWATDQGNWNKSGPGGQGVFYQCTSTNTWTLYYTPYTYPHPLTQTATSGSFVSGGVKLSGGASIH